MHEEGSTKLQWKIEIGGSHEGQKLPRQASTHRVALLLDSFNKIIGLIIPYFESIVLIVKEKKQTEAGTALLRSGREYVNLNLISL